MMLCRVAVQEAAPAVQEDPALRAIRAELAELRTLVMAQQAAV